MSTFFFLVMKKNNIQALQDSFGDKKQKDDIIYLAYEKFKDYPTSISNIMYRFPENGT
ncbi:hypothetical protein [Chryseobacterium bernardetii]|uniref:hypothetical protein n=1 Tax=Chryseobacterium bernardetii TaxID=1241978 RepID=UPI003AF70BE2